MALSFLAAKPPFISPSPAADGSLSYFDGAVTLWNSMREDGTFVSKVRYKAGSPYTSKGSASPTTPPLHYHLQQVETLEVLGGTMTYVLDGVETSAKAGEKLVIQPGQVHTFWSGSEDEDLVMQAISPPVGKEDCRFNERFICNFYGYLSSCAAAGVEPSAFQIFRFLDSADVAIAAPLGLGRVMNLALGRIGGGLLGYKTEYPEFAAK